MPVTGGLTTWSELESGSSKWTRGGWRQRSASPPFFAVFALGLLGFAVLGYVVDEPVADQTVQRFLDEHLPRMDTDELRAARGAAGLIALVSLPVIGLLWVGALRSAIRAVWRVEEYPGRFLVRC